MDDLGEMARSWVGTRYAHQGRRKREDGTPGGVDCLGLLIGIAGELNLDDREGGKLWRRDVTAYSRQPDTEALRRCLVQWLWPVGESAPFAEGQVALFEIDGRAQHLGIIARAAEGDLSLIHAYAPARKVVEHRLDESWRRRCVARFALSEAGGDREACEDKAGRLQP